MSDIKVNSKMLGVLAELAEHGADRIRGVFFGNGEMVATDGISMVRVTIATNGERFMMTARHAGAAAAMATSTGCVDLYLRRHKDFPGLVEASAVFGLTMSAPRGDHLTYPSPSHLDGVRPKSEPTNGIVFDPHRLDLLRRLAEACSNNLTFETHLGGTMEGMRFRSQAGRIDVVIMPCRSHYDVDDEVIVVGEDPVSPDEHAVVLNPEAIGDPNQTPIVKCSPALAALINAGAAALDGASGGKNGG